MQCSGAGWLCSNGDDRSRIGCLTADYRLEEICASALKQRDEERGNAVLTATDEWVTIAEVNPPTLPDMSYLIFEGERSHMLITDNVIGNPRVPPYGFGARITHDAPPVALFTPALSAFASAPWLVLAGFVVGGAISVLVLP